MLFKQNLQLFSLIALLANANKTAIHHFYNKLLQVEQKERKRETKIENNMAKGVKLLRLQNTHPKLGIIFYRLKWKCFHCWKCEEEVAIFIRWKSGNAIIIVAQKCDSSWANELQLSPWPHFRQLCMWLWLWLKSTSCSISIDYTKRSFSLSFSISLSFSTSPALLAKQQNPNANIYLSRTMQNRLFFPMYWIHCFWLRLCFVDVRI